MSTPKVHSGSEQKVLYVDDDADDRMLLSDAFRVASPTYQTIEVGSGPEALKYLTEESQLPCLVILDLNMPGMSGKELLYEMRKNEKLRQLPVVVFTTSSNPSDQKEFAAMGIDMITKPASFAELTKMVKTLTNYCGPRSGN